MIVSNTQSINYCRYAENPEWKSDKQGKESSFFYYTLLAILGVKPNLIGS